MAVQISKLWIIFASGAGYRNILPLPVHRPHSVTVLAYWLPQSVRDHNLRQASVMPITQLAGCLSCEACWRGLSPSAKDRLPPLPGRSPADRKVRLGSTPPVCQADCGLGAGFAAPDHYPLPPREFRRLLATRGRSRKVAIPKRRRLPDAGVEAVEHVSRGDRK